MTAGEAKKRVKKAIDALNSMQDALLFEMEETDYSFGFKNKGRATGASYGAYCHTAFFDDYRKKKDAYMNVMQFAELLVAASKLNDPAAYHNLCET